MKKELLQGFTQEQLEKIRTCESGEDLLELAKSEGVELTEEQLSAINGGCLTQRKPPHQHCPICHSENTRYTYYDLSSAVADYQCDNCGHHWESKI